MMTEKIPTTEKLARMLEELNDPRLDGIIKKARAGYYDDFKSPLATPEIQLVIDLRATGYPDVAERVIDGEYDATPEESAAWWNSQETKREFGTDWEKLNRIMMTPVPKKTSRDPRGRKIH